MMKIEDVPAAGEVIVATRYAYRVLIQVHGSQIEEVRGVDPRAPRDVRLAWIGACRAQAERSRDYDHRAQLANMKNEALGKKVADGLDEPEIADVQPPPEDHGTEDEQLCLAGREDGSGYASVVAGLIVGIACDGIDR